ncbi:MAG TPA: bifunctional helix-turn-helix transcriptional regulator/GNAT family N-acetyltransferase [Chitinophaga sp.]
MSDVLVQLGHLASGSRLKRITDKLYIDGDKIYKDNNIDFKASWFSIYYVLANAAAPMTILEITGQIYFSHITVKNILRELEEEGLVVIKPNPNDKRSKLAALSEKGKRLRRKLEPVWLSIAGALKEVFTLGHPDFSNILNRIDREINQNPINERAKSPGNEDQVTVVDYQPALKKDFHNLVAPWLLEVTGGKLEEEDKFTINNPDKAYLVPGGFLFFARYKGEIAGCVALKRLSENEFEFAKLYIRNEYRNLGIATKLIERCISRCKENEAKRLWLQTTNRMPQAHKLYYKLGFTDSPAPGSMDVLVRTEKIMFLEL